MRYLLLFSLTFFFISNAILNAQQYYWSAAQFKRNEIPGFAPSYLHKDRKALAINSVKYPDQTAAVEKVFTGQPGIYSLQLHTLLETDGECPYEIFLNGKSIGQMTNPPTLIDYWPAVHTLKNISLKDQDVIRITFSNTSNGKVPEGDGFAYARGRWTGIALTPQGSRKPDPLAGKNVNFFIDINGVSLRSKGRILLESLPMAHWAIGTNWQKNWPGNWRFAQPDSLENANQWILLHGQINVPGKGIMKMRDAYRLEKGILKGIRRWEWMGKDTLKNATLSIQFQNPASNKKVYMPGLQYYGNPSGYNSGATPWYQGTFGERAIYEEHRFPMPFVCQEFHINNAYYGAALHSLPGPVHYGQQQDQWWSMGCERNAAGTIFQILSGPTASNRQNSVIKARQSGDDYWQTYDQAWVDIPPGAIIEKTFFLEAYPASVQNEGAAFQTAQRTSIELFEPFYFNGLPSFEDIIQDKYTFAQTRWIEGKGFNQFDPQYDRGAFIVIGWVGQAAAMGYALQALAPQLQDTDIPKMVQQSLDLVSTAEFYEKGFRTWYHTAEQKWGDRIWRPLPEWLSQGQGMFNMANAIRQGRLNNYQTKEWELFLKKAADFHSNRILSDMWEPKSTNEAFFIAPLCLASRLFDQKEYLNAAKKAGSYYIRRHQSMKEPYWGGTLDARCEDKEGAFGAFQAFLYLYETTKDHKFLEAAKHACNVMLSYTYIWDVDLPAARLRDHQFKSRGWTSVSVQNMHLDVYGVLLSPFVYRLGQLTDDAMLKNMAELMYRSCGQLIDPYGSQGEQVQQTNYSQNKNDHSVVEEYRGAYVEDWTVFWITAHFLNAAALFEEFKRLRK